MNYILIDWKINGSLKDNGDGTSSQAIIVNVGIEGDKYGFIAPNPQKNMTTIIFSNKNLDIDQIKQFVTTKANEYVNTTYPNT